MQVVSAQPTGNNSSIMWFFKDKGFDDKSINAMLKKCKRLEDVQREKADENWAYLTSIGILERKLPNVVARCPKILSLGLDEKLIPMVQFLGTLLGTKPNDIATAVTKFPQILAHSVEEKLCPLLAFFESLGIHENQLGKMLMFNPRIISYSIESKLAQIVEFLSSLGLSNEVIGKVLVKIHLSWVMELIIGCDQLLSSCYPWAWQKKSSKH